MTTSVPRSIPHRRLHTTSLDAVTIGGCTQAPSITMVTAKSAFALLPWLVTNTAAVRRLLYRDGAVLLRGFTDGIAALRQIAEAVAGEPTCDYVDGATPRRELSPGVFTSTEYPGDQAIELHNEGCYSATWPLLLVFACEVPADTGGQTPLADTRRVLERMPARVRQRLEQHGVRYVRNFTDGVGMSVANAFGVEVNDVISHCAANGIDAEWLDQNRLRTVAWRPALVRHPITGEWAWFNQATSFHLSTIGTQLASELIAQVGVDAIPKTTRCGDDTEFGEQDLADIREAFAAETLRFDWSPDDVLLVDNIAMAHGRAPFMGPRSVSVTMAGTRTWQDVQSRPAEVNDG